MNANKCSHCRIIGEIMYESRRIVRYRCYRCGHRWTEMIEIFELDQPEDDDETFIYGSDDMINNLGLMGYEVIELPNGRYAPCGLRNSDLGTQEFLSEAEAWDHCLSDHDNSTDRRYRWYMY